MRNFYLWIVIVVVILVCCFLCLDGKLFFNKNTVKKEISCATHTGIDLQICKFMNFKSPFSTVEVVDKVLTTKKGVVSKLGLVGIAKAEGVVLGYLEKDDNFLILVGFDGFDGKRFVTLVRAPAYIIEDKDNPVGFVVNKVKTRNLSDDEGYDVLKTRYDVVSKIKLLIDSVVVLEFTDIQLDNKDSDYVSKTEFGRRLLVDLLGQVPATQSLLGKLDDNNLMSAYDGFSGDVAYILSENDINTVDVGKLPIVLAITTNSGYNAQ